MNIRYINVYANLYGASWQSYRQCVRAVGIGTRPIYRLIIHLKGCECQRCINRILRKRAERRRTLDLES